MAETIHLVEFNDKIIETTVTNKASVAQYWLQNIAKSSKRRGKNCRIVGMGCKYVRHPINSMSNKVAILQLCVDTKCLVLQLQHMDYTPHSIIDFLNDSQTTFVGVEIQANSLKLLKDYALKVSHKVDLHFLAKRWFPVSYKGRPSMKALAYGVVGLSMRKKSDDYKGDWESVVLDQELVEQACTDAYACYVIAHKLLQDDHV
ncbi:werner syndrome-like exonuclease [Phtheirospermum japonicum]|uniref:Werner syndrome-like exonuclease n=1 Tax=Phtheirospermum japonicum TaxID=374723 RepID=A0A830B5L4_9LAMI|nr:werner syndrome-like exonuclease [Phtheirospermum japonicum]